MPLLTNIQLILPATNETFITKFIHYLSPHETIGNDSLELKTSDETYIPKITFQFKHISIPCASFVFDDTTAINVDITNTTGITKQSTYQYAPISLEAFIERMKPYPLFGLDHTGFNLPYFNGIHPKILELRETLKHTCLYHTFPKHLEDAPWDFIIPGTAEETSNIVPVDYFLVRKPKFEIVSFDNASTPLIQIDMQFQGKFEDFAKLFPEAIPDPALRNLWVYIQNDFSLDICFVVNEASENDWSYQFAKERLA